MAARAAHASRSRWLQRSRLATPAPRCAPGSAMILAAASPRAPDLLWRGLAEASSTVTVTTAVHGAPILAVFAHALLVSFAPPRRRILAEPRPYVPRRTPANSTWSASTLQAPSAAILPRCFQHCSAGVKYHSAFRPRLPRIVPAGASQLPLHQPTHPCLSCEDPRLHQSPSRVPAGRADSSLGSLL